MRTDGLALFASEIRTVHEERNPRFESAALTGAASFEQLVNRLAPRLRAVSLAILGDDVLAEEACVRVFMRAHRTLPNSPNPWLDLVRSVISQCRRLRRWSLFEWRSPAFGWLKARGANPKQKEAIRLLQLLPCNQRILLALREVAELSPEQIGTILGRSVASIKSDLLSARQALLKAARA